ncbi:MAG: hypothetical protein JSV43_05905 [Methanobacteriota archaeon]|nr:MAG: hypothetical protein JSV43_05905 [Euryarchaeota archaeon]
MKWKYAAVLAVALMMATAFSAIASAHNDEDITSTPNALEQWLAVKEFQNEAYAYIEEVSPTNYDGEMFAYEDGPFPMYDDNGRPPGSPLHLPWGGHYVSDINSLPPHNPGIGSSTIHSGAAGFVSVGAIHESYLGDQNGNGILEWLVYYNDKTLGTDGKDNDGDGCIDEKAYWQWDPSRGGPCDLIPDQITFYETGANPDIGGESGDLLVHVDWYSSPASIEIYRINVSPRFMTTKVRALGLYPEIAGDFIAFSGPEFYYQENANDDMDDDMYDLFVGSIDVRGFPGRQPVTHACAAGIHGRRGVTFQRDDGWVVTSFELIEFFDRHDWNGDGDIFDRVAAYYAIDPATGNCRENVVNGGVQGAYAKNSGYVLTTGYTLEWLDDRDWDKDGWKFEFVQLWHDIESTWRMKGEVYKSHTFRAHPPKWGFGWWGLYNDNYQSQTFPLRFGGAYYRNLGRSEGYYHTYFFLTADEDGNRHTMLPRHYVGIGQPGGSPGGVCIQMFVREYNAEYAGIKLIGGIADGNGDGDTEDTLEYIFCLDETGNGDFIVEPTSKYAKGYYQDPIPFYAARYIWFSSGGALQGHVSLPGYYNELLIHDDSNGNLILEDFWYHTTYQFNLGPGGTSEEIAPREIDERYAWRLDQYPIATPIQ